MSKYIKLGLDWEDWEEHQIIRITSPSGNCVSFKNGQGESFVRLKSVNSHLHMRILYHRYVNILLATKEEMKDIVKASMPDES